MRIDGILLDRSCGKHSFKVYWRRSAVFQLPKADCRKAQDRVLTSVSATKDSQHCRTIACFQRHEKLSVGPGLDRLFGGGLHLRNTTASFRLEHFCIVQNQLDVRFSRIRR